MANHFASLAKGLVSHQLFCQKILYNFSVLTGNFILKKKLLFSFEGFPVRPVAQVGQLFFAASPLSFFILLTTFNKLLRNYSFFSSLYGFN